MDDFPDPDFSFVMGPTPAALSQLGRDFSDLETKLDGHANAVRGQAKGKRVDDNTGRIHVGSQGVRNAAALATAGGVALNAAKGAAQRYMDTVMGGPVPAQYVDVVYQRDVVVPAAKQKMMDEATSASAREFQDETNKLATMRSIRQGAKEVLELQDKQIAAAAQSAHGSVPKPAASGDMPQEGGHSSGSAAPGSAAAGGGKGGAPSQGGVPGSSNKAGTGAGKGDEDGQQSQGQGQGQGQPGQQQQGQQPQPGQGQQPQTQPQSGAPGMGKDAALSDPTHDSDSGRHRSGIPGALGAVGGMGGAAAGAGAAKPAANGVTKDGLVTNSNVSGKVNLSAAAPGSGPVKQAGGVPRAAAGGGMPMMPPVMPQVNGTAPKRNPERIVSDVDPGLHGLNQVLDAVRGGTILRNEFDPTDPPKSPQG